MEKETKEILVEDCCCHRTKHRSEKEYKDLIHRLTTGSKDRSAALKEWWRGRTLSGYFSTGGSGHAALKSFNKALLAEHIRSCVARDIKEDKEGAVDELIQTLNKIMK